MVLLLKSKAVALSKLQLHAKLVLQRNNFPSGAEIKEENYEFSNHAYSCAVRVSD